MKGNRRESVMEKEREMMGFEEKTRTVQDDLDNIAKVGKVTSLQFISNLYIYIYIYTLNRNVICYLKLKYDS